MTVTLRERLHLHNGRPPWRTFKVEARVYGPVDPTALVVVTDVVRAPTAAEATHQAAIALARVCRRKPRLLADATKVELDVRLTVSR